MIQNKFDSTQQNLFFPEDEGKLEKDTAKKIKNKERAAKSAETRKKNKHKKEMDDLHKFEKEHPESFLFKEQKEFFNILDRITKPSDSKFLNETFFNRYKESPYDDNEKQTGASQPLKDDVSLFHIRQRVEEIIRNCNVDDVEICKKQVMRLYKMVDAMINQGFILTK